MYQYYKLFNKNIFFLYIVFKNILMVIFLITNNLSPIFYLNLEKIFFLVTYNVYINGFTIYFHFFIN